MNSPSTSQAYDVQPQAVMGRRLSVEGAVGNPTGATSMDPPVQYPGTRRVPPALSITGAYRAAIRRGTYPSLRFPIHAPIALGSWTLFGSLFKRTSTGPSPV